MTMMLTIIAIGSTTLAIGLGLSMWWLIPKIQLKSYEDGWNDAWDAAEANIQKTLNEPQTPEEKAVEKEFVDMQIRKALAPAWSVKWPSGKRVH